MENTQKTGKTSEKSPTNVLYLRYLTLNAASSPKTYTKPDILNRVVIRDLYGNLESWSQAVTTSRHNLSNIHSGFSGKLDIMQDQECMNNISDNDAVVITKLGIHIMTNNLTDLFMADNWEVLADNASLLDDNQLDYINDDNKIKLTDIRSVYEDDNWANSVKKAKNILSKEPPKKFVDKWPIIGSKEFRNRMKLSDENSVIAVKIAMSLGKNKSIVNVFMTDDWELLRHNIKLVTVEVSNPKKEEPKKSQPTQPKKKQAKDKEKKVKQTL